MSDLTASFVATSVRFLTEDYLPKITRALEPLSDADIWWRPNEASNSIGNLLLHLRGNVSQWIVGGVGHAAVHRQRQAEFDARAGGSAAALLDALTGTVDEAVRVIERQTGATLQERRAIQGYDVSVLEAIYHVVEHFSMHTGQIILLAKARAGVDLRLWEPPARQGSGGSESALV